MAEPDYGYSPSSNFSLSSLFIAFFSGAALGAIAGLLTAPKPGRDLWSDLSQMATDAKDKVAGWVGRSTESAVPA
jgi:gas vesicle protein